MFFHMDSDFILINQYLNKTIRIFKQLSIHMLNFLFSSKVNFEP
jgi:hypothetical protein